MLVTDLAVLEPDNYGNRQFNRFSGPLHPRKKQVDGGRLSETD